MNTIRIKLIILPQEVIRRFNIAKDTPLESFQQQVATHLAGSANPQYQYLDEDDEWVSFSSGDEWNDALKRIEEDEVFRVRVTTTAAEETESVVASKCCKFTPEWKKKNVPKIIMFIVFVMSHPLLALLALFAIVHHAKHNPDSQLVDIAKKIKEHRKKIFALFLIRLLVCKPCLIIPVLILIGIKKACACHFKRKCWKKCVKELCHERQEKTSAEQASGEYSETLKMLELLGFTDEKLNKHLVNNFKGDLTQTVSALLKLKAAH
jgi:hypothetical protein